MSWIAAPLREVATVIGGTTPDSTNPAYWGGTCVWVTPTDLGALPGGVIRDSARKVTAEAVASCSLPIVPARAVVMSSRAPIGHLAIAGCDLLTNQGCKSFACGDSLDPMFLYFALMHRMPAIQALGSGATFVEVSKSTLEGLEISFPASLDLQRHLASRLVSQFAEVDAARRAATTQATEVALLRRRVLAELFAAVEDAPRKRLGDHASTTSGSTPPRGIKAYWAPAEVPWVKTGEVAFAPISSTSESISRRALAECSLTLLPPGTVLVAMYGQGKTRGQSAILEVAATTNQACFAIPPNDAWEPIFLFHWMMAHYHDLRELSEGRGGNQANLNGALLNALEVPAPSRTQQAAIARRAEAALREVQALADANAAQRAELERLPQRLLAQIFEN